MLISGHRDGRIIADAVGHFGITSIAGSSSRGGLAALRAMIKQLKNGDCVGITPDGPRGPAMQASQGIVAAARLAQVPIIPLAYATRRRRVMRSWDRFYFPFPFTEGLHLWGEPIEVPADSDDAAMERYRQFVEDRLNALGNEADRRMGHDPLTFTASLPLPPGPSTSAQEGRGEGSSSAFGAADHASSDSPHPALSPRERVQEGCAVKGGERTMNALAAYRGVTTMLGPLLPLYLAARRARGKEDRARFGERLGHAGTTRPPGPLAWLHAASVGEAASLLSLIERLNRERPALNLLVTTGTVTSARLLETRLPAGQARHQFVPVDRPLYVRRFLDHWRPDLAIWVESELWPNLVAATQARGIPTVLLNGRVSQRSYKRWRRWPGLIAPLLGRFALCLAQDAAQAVRLVELGARNAGTVGDLKSAAAPLPADAHELAQLGAEIDARPRWLAASTHQGEEDAVAAAHRKVQPRHPGLLTIIAPRHPVRATEIAASLRSQGLGVARRSQGDAITAAVAIYLADTLGEMGLFYRLADIAFIGGSLTPVGGHNPLEAALLGSAILHGPDMSNCAAAAHQLAQAGGAIAIGGTDELAAALDRLLADPTERRRRSKAAGAVAARDNGVLDSVLTRLAPYLDAVAPVKSPSIDAGPEERGVGMGRARA
jgi:3-deoxy-D-manno-octulosonic-acid transferase